MFMFARIIQVTFSKRKHVHVKSTQHLSPVRPNKRRSYPHLAVILNHVVMGAITKPSLMFIFLKKGIMGTLLATVGCILLTGL